MHALRTLYFCSACRAAVDPAGRDYPGADAAHPCDGCGTLPEPPRAPSHSRRRTPPPDEAVVRMVPPEQWADLAAGRCPQCGGHTLGRLPGQHWYCAECAVEWRAGRRRRRVEREEAEQDG